MRLSISDYRKKLLVTFDNAGKKVEPCVNPDDLADPFGYRFVRDRRRDFNVLSFSFIGQPNWYREPVFHEAVERLGSVMKGRFPSIYGYGSSMGAFGVAAFSGVLHIDRVLLLNPISTLKPELSRWETGRFGRIQTKFDWDTKYHDSMDCGSSGYIVYDNTFDLDSRHVVRYGPNLTRLRLPGVGHGVAMHLQSMNVLKWLVRNFLDDTVSKEHYNRLARKRRSIGAYYNFLLGDRNVHLTPARREVILKHQQAFMAWRRKPGKAAPVMLNLKQINTIRDSAILLERQQPEFAICLMQLAGAARPGGGFIQRKLKQMEARLKRLHRRSGR